MNEQCAERCLGVAGHAGFHQTSDYSAIRRDERRNTVERIRAAIDALPGQYVSDYDLGWMVRRESVDIALGEVAGEAVTCE